jgi:hypothetical protein
MPDRMVDGRERGDRIGDSEQIGKRDVRPDGFPPGGPADGRYPVVVEVGGE